MAEVKKRASQIATLAKKQTARLLDAVTGAGLEEENDPHKAYKELFAKADVGEKGYLTGEDMFRMVEGSQLDQRLQLDDEVLEVVADLLVERMDPNLTGMVGLKQFILALEQFHLISDENASPDKKKTPAARRESQVALLSQTDSPSSAGPSTSISPSLHMPMPPSAAVVNDRIRDRTGDLHTLQETSPTLNAPIASNQRVQAPPPYPQATTDKGKEPLMPSDPQTYDVISLPSGPTNIHIRHPRTGTFRAKFRKSVKSSGHAISKALAALAPTDIDEWTNEDPSFRWEGKMLWEDRLAWRLHRYWEFEGEKALMYMLIFGLNIAMYAIWWCRYWSIERYRTTTLSIPFAKGFTGMLYLDVCLVFFSMCRNTLTAIRGYWHSSIASPINKHIVVHRILGYLIVFASTGHGLCHLIGSFPTISSAPSADALNSIFSPRHPFTKVPTYGELLLSTPGWTGLVLIIALYVMLATALQAVRDRKFEAFWYTHHLFLLFAGLLYFHGWEHWLAKPEMLYWMTPPLLLYLGERALRMWRASQPITVLAMKPLQPDVTMIEMLRPKHCHPRPGHYVFLCVPSISRFQWHPFTLSSSPEEQILRVHIKDNGDWTRQLRELALSHSKGSPKPSYDPLGRSFPEIQVDGPFGAPAEHIYEYQHVVMVAAGIGVTPFAAALRDIELKLRNRKSGLKKLCSVDFYWINRTQAPATWFRDMLKGIRSDPIARDRVHVHMHLTTSYSKEDSPSLLLWHGLRLAEEQRGLSLLTDLDEATCWGRPDFRAVLREAQANCIRNEMTMGVFYCGPKGLSKQLYGICRKLSRDNGLPIAYQKENF